jgi:hypothetical protein
MAGKNQVTLTFAGDAKPLQGTVDQVEGSTKRMGAGFAKLGRSLEKDIGVRVDKVGGGLNLLSQFIGGPLGGALTAGAFAMDTMSTALSIVSLANIKAAAAWTVHKAAVIGSTVATWAMSVAMKSLPIFAVISALTLLAVGIMYVWKHSERFRAIVTGAFSAVVGFVRRNWPLMLAILTGPIGLAVLAIMKHKDKILGFFRGIPAAVKGFFSGLAEIITAPIRIAVQGIRNAWNNTIGGKGFTAPSWVPGIGGKGFHIPRLHQGGTVPGPPGAEVLTLLQAGERVSAAGGGGGDLVINGGLHVHANNVHQLVEELQRYAKQNGGLKIKIAV